MSADSLDILDILHGDLRCSRRALRRAPGFAAAALVTLALGIGATTAIFAVVHSVLIEPLPYRDADRLVQLFQRQSAAASPTGAPRRVRINLSASELVELRRRARTVSHIGAVNLAFMIMTGGDETTRLEGARVSPAIFQMRGVPPLTGRLGAMLFGLTPLDPMTFVAVSIMFAAVAAGASYVPARHAADVSPLVALRSE